MMSVVAVAVIWLTAIRTNLFAGKNAVSIPVVVGKRVIVAVPFIASDDTVVVTILAVKSHRVRMTVVLTMNVTVMIALMVMAFASMTLVILALAMVFMCPFPILAFLFTLILFLSFSLPFCPETLEIRCR
jgi:hypothetical protein